MRVKSAPLGFVTGGTLSPRVLNANLSHVARGIEDVAAERYVHSVIRLPYHRSASTPYTQADSDDVREYVLNLPTRWSIERAYLRYYGTAADTVRIDVYEGSSLMEGEYLTIDAISPASAAAAFSGKRLECPADTDVKFRLEGAGNFSSQWTFLELHIRADRYNTDGTDGTPSYVPARFSAADTRDADALNAELNTQIDVEVDKIEAAPTWTKVEVYVQHNLTDDGEADRTWRLPYVDSAKTKRTAVRMRGYAVMESAPASSTEANWHLVDDNAASQFDLKIDCTAVGTAEEDSGVISESIAKATPDLFDPLDGWTLSVDGNGVNEAIDKTYCLLIYS